MLISCITSGSLFANSILIPMDKTQRNHLKAYGVAFFTLREGLEVNWLLNYRGGSFMIDYNRIIESECAVRGITYEIISDAKANAIETEIADPEKNMNIVKLETAPKIAVYSPKNEFIDDETDAVITVLKYAEIPFDIIYDEEILQDQLVKYDWLHLHHEDFTGQKGRNFWRNEDIIAAQMQEETARKFGFAKVSHMKLAVAKRIKAFTASGKYLFAMCSGAETFDIALAAEGVDINESMYDGDGVDPNAQSKLDFSKSLAFENFTLEYGGRRRFSDINTDFPGFREYREYYFTLFTYSAKWDVIPSILTQNHENVIREFTGQTTAFNGYLIKPDVEVLGENKEIHNVRYIYGELGNGHWTYYSGHDPENEPGRGGMRKTNLDLYPNSPGYRLILNNVLFPSAKKKKQKT